MTAGHCLDNVDDNVIFQYNTHLGGVHLNGYNSNYDFGLVEVNGSPILRQVTNGIYSISVDTATGYDASFSGSFGVTQGLPVCKVGINSDRTCGTIAVERYTANNLVRVIVAGETGKIFSEGGDSEGAWFTASKPYRLVGIHQGGTKDLPGGESLTSYFTPWLEVADRYGLYLYTNTDPDPLN